MRPRNFRKGSAGTEIRFAVGACRLGLILVACSERGVCAILLGDEAEVLVRELEGRFPKATLLPGGEGLDAMVAQVIQLVERPGGEVLALPLDLRGTAFQQRVWRALQAIPPGATTTYTEIAARIGEPRAVRAVAGACAANALAVVIPCHRVVRRDGELSGYRWGIARKRQLLAIEAEGLT